MSVSELHRVVYLKPYEEEIRELAAAREAAMVASGRMPPRTRKNPRDWRQRLGKAEGMKVLGFAGELTYELLTGYPMDRTHVDFDRGTDFPNGEDVKAVDVWGNPILMRHTKLSLTAPWYVLVAVDFDTWRATITGWASREELAHAPLKDFGEGPTRCLGWERLHTMGLAEEIWLRAPRGPR